MIDNYLKLDTVNKANPFNMLWRTLTLKVDLKDNLKLLIVSCM